MSKTISVLLLITLLIPTICSAQVDNKPEIEVVVNKETITNWKVDFFDVSTEFPVPGVTFYSWEEIVIPEYQELKIKISSVVDTEVFLNCPNPEKVTIQNVILQLQILAGIRP